MKKKKFIIGALILLIAMTAHAADPMDLDTFMGMAEGCYGTDACDDEIGIEACLAELDYALEKNLITKEVYYWGVANGFFPMIDRHDWIAAISKCGYAHAADPMDLNTFIQRAEENAGTNGCEISMEGNIAGQYLEYALENNFITREAYDWGGENGYYPVFAWPNEFIHVCKAGW